MIDWSVLVAWAVGPGPASRPFSATATGGRRLVSIPYKTRRDATAIAPALARALAQATR